MSDGATLPALRQELLQSAVDEYYSAMAEKGQVPALGRDVSNFELTSDCKLRLKAFPGIELVGRYSRPLALTTIASRRGGSAAIRDGLGFVDWSARRKLPSVAQQALRKVDDEAAAAALASTADIDESIDSLIDVVDTAAQTTQTLPTDRPTDPERAPRARHDPANFARYESGAREQIGFPPAADRGLP